MPGSFILEAEGLELLARIAAGFGQLLYDVLQGWKSHAVADVVLQLQLLSGSGVLEQIAHRATDVPGHHVQQRIALGMDRAGIERMFAVADAEEAGGLFEGFRAKARHVPQFLPGLERPVLVAMRDDIGRQ
jgi:hypothetical protein